MVTKAIKVGLPSGMTGDGGVTMVHPAFLKRSICKIKQPDRLQSTFAKGFLTVLMVLFLKMRSAIQPRLPLALQSTCLSITVVRIVGMCFDTLLSIINNSFGKQLLPLTK